MRLSIEGQTVAMISLAAIGPPVRIEFWKELGPAGSRDHTLEIDGDYQLGHALSGDERRPAKAPPHVDVAYLLGTKVTSAVADEDGSLHITFEGEATLDIPSADLEPWQLLASGQPIVVSGAGGGLHEWSE